MQKWRVAENDVSKDVSFHTVAHAVREAKFVPRVEDFEGICSAFCVHCIQKDYKNRFIFFLGILNDYSSVEHT